MVDVPKILLFFILSCTSVCWSNPEDNNALCLNLNNFCFSAMQQCGSGRPNYNRHAIGTPGKKGPKGEPGAIGQQGPRGPPGVVDYGDIANLFETKFADRFNQLENRISVMEEKIEKGSAALESCGVRYRGKCFKIPEDLHEVQNVDFAEAKRMCRNIGWKLANIYSTEHYNSIASYLRTKIPSLNYASVWLGMTRNPKTQVTYLSNGDVAFTLPWYPGFPSFGSTYTKISLYTKLHKTSPNQGIVNQSPTISRRGALCEL